MSNVGTGANDPIDMIDRAGNNIASRETEPLATPDAPPVPHAIVLTKLRIVRQGGFEYHVPVGSVIGLRTLSPSVVAAGNATFNPGADAKLMVAGSLKPGDVVAE